MNSADTWVDMWKYNYDSINGTYVNFLSERGAIEAFIFASATHPQRVQKNLAEITGFTALPPVNTLGFHFSKWAPVSAEMI